MLPRTLIFLRNINASSHDVKNLSEEYDIVNYNISEGVVFSEGVSQLELEDLLRSDTTDVQVEG